MAVFNGYTYGSRKKFGIGITLGIGMLQQPQTVAANMISITERIAILSPFLNFEDSPIDLYNMAQNKGFCKGFPGIL
jgi:hypothetical protein